MNQRFQNLGSVLSKEVQKNITGKGGCGVFLEGRWQRVIDSDHDGRTMDQVQTIRAELPGIGWCCDSCPWN